VFSCLIGQKIKTFFITSFFFFVPIFLSSNTIVFNKIEESSYNTEGLVHRIKASKKTINLEKLKHFSIFNQKKTISEAIYYTNGTFYVKGIKIDFTTGYFYEGYFYMKGCFARTKSTTIQAKSVIYKKKYIIFKNLILNKKNKIYHKFKYLVEIK